MPSDAELFSQTEHGVQSAVEWLRLLVESVGALVIALGIVVALGLLLRSVLSRRQIGFSEVRLVFARHLALALEFQLAADILSTAIAPTWERIGKLAAIAVIRTALNYFLMLEMKGESAQAAQAGPPAAGPRGEG